MRASQTALRTSSTDIFEEGHWHRRRSGRALLLAGRLHILAASAHRHLRRHTRAASPRSQSQVAQRSRRTRAYQERGEAATAAPPPPAAASPAAAAAAPSVSSARVPAARRLATRGRAARRAHPSFPAPPSPLCSRAAREPRGAACGWRLRCQVPQLLARSGGQVAGPCPTTCPRQPRCGTGPSIL
eukprot:scaffold2404_cov398-Prasinococcus_capsulatus_cf.AAC.52